MTRRFASYMLLLDWIPRMEVRPIPSQGCLLPWGPLDFAPVFLVRQSMLPLVAKLTLISVCFQNRFVGCRFLVASIGLQAFAQPCCGQGILTSFITTDCGAAQISTLCLPRTSSEYRL